MILVLLLLFQDLSSQGAAAMREQRYPEAIKIYRELSAKDKANPMWRMNLGMALAMQGQHQEALTEFTAFLKARSQPGPTHFFTGLQLLKLDRPCDAIRPLETARKWRATPDVLVELADAYQGCKHWEQAAETYQKANQPRQSAHCWWLARQYEKAKPLYASVEKQHDKDPEFQFEYGDTLARLEGAESGLPHLEKAVASAPNLTAARGALGRALMELNRPGDALPHLEKAAPTDPTLLLPLSKAYRAVGRPEDAARTEQSYKAKVVPEKQQIP
jgi:tetratricopeptide (TPR) repeat protein